jgi:hypothetical protein
MKSRLSENELNSLVRIGEGIISGSIIGFFASAAALLISGRLDGQAKETIIASGYPPDVTWLIVLTFIGIFLGDSIRKKSLRQLDQKSTFRKVSRKNGQTRLL